MVFILNLYPVNVVLTNSFSDEGLSIDASISCLIVWLHFLLLHLKLR